MTEFKNVKRKGDLVDGIKKAGTLLLVVGGIVAVASYIGDRAIKNTIKYDFAPEITHKIQKGERLGDYFTTENTSKDLNFDDYKNLIIRVNQDKYINRGDGYKNILSNPDNLPEGEPIVLKDIDRNGYVGAPKKEK